MPWLPKLLMMLRPHATTALPTLLKEAVALFPSQPGCAQRLATAVVSSRSARRSGRPFTYGPDGDRCENASRSLATGVSSLLADYPATTEALSAALGLPANWVERRAEPVFENDQMPVDGAGTQSEPC